MNRFSSFSTALVLALATAAVYANNPCENIRNGQFVCADCQTLAYCIQEDGQWLTLELASCDNTRSMFCNEDARSCTYQRTCGLPALGNGRFNCQNPGQYPDPYDCRIYHVCSELNEDKRLNCPTGYIYSAATKSCIAGSYTNAAVCQQAQFSCASQGQIGAWPGDANIYYVCQSKDVPLLYRCQNGKIFDGNKCIDGNGNGNGDTGNGGIGIDGTGNGGTLNGGTLNGGTLGAACTGNELKANPSNCRAYYRCEKGQLVAQSCAANAFFDTVNLACKFGSC